MFEKAIIDADLCIKLGSSEKFRFLCSLLPLLSKTIYIHSQTLSEIKYPPSSVSQIKELIRKGQVIEVHQSGLNAQDRAVYDAAYESLKNVMWSSKAPNKNLGEMCSLAYAKATGIPVFATDEKDLQPIIDSQLNTGINNIACIRIVDIISLAHEGKMEISRKNCKLLWVISGKSKIMFDTEIWPFNK